ncbi:MAG: DUF1285 domain-containing protein [Candidatus Saccharibacteria bacterium]|nr:DUF1285 domain-containing protein [Moraxellaceae bacterium]
MTTSTDFKGNLGQSKSNLDSLSRLLVDENGQPLKAAPPLEKWNPTYCGEMDLVIRANGEWWHEGVRMTREPLIKLFATVLWREVDDDSDRYYLKTPVEKIQIQVEDAPLLVVDVTQVVDDGLTYIRCTTKTGDVVIANTEHRIEMRIFNQNGVHEVRPYIRIRRNLDALIHRNAFYHLIGWSELQPKDGGEVMILQSGQEQFVLGTI